VTLRVERPADGVALVTLDRPEKRNALSIELRAEAADALARLGAADDVRCTVITGAPPAFSSGMDFTEFGGPREQRERLLVANEAFFGALLEHPVPLVAAVNGPALAGGFAVALLCDVRVAARSAVMGFPELGRGIPPSLGTAMRVLPPGIARELCLTGRVLSAPEALELGVVSCVAGDGEVVGEAVRIAEQIAGRDPRAVRTVVAWTRAPAADWREQLDRERALLRSSLLG
jgi:enoyl-CoA hydratase